MAIAFRNAQSTAGGTDASSVTITKPTGTVSGDVLIAAIMCDGGTGVTITPPSGFNLIFRTDNSTAMAYATYYKVAGGSEGANYQFTLGATRGAPVGAISGYSGADNSTPINASAETNWTASLQTSLVAPATTTTVANCCVIRAFGIRRGTDVSPTITPPASTSERYEISQTRPTPTSFSHTVEAADLIQASSGDTGTATATASQSAVYGVHTIALAPAGAASGVTDNIGMVGT